MPRFMTAYFLKEDQVFVYDMDESYTCIEFAQDAAEDWVWQFAPDKKIAIEQHDAKLVEWRNNPTKDTY
jgi:hypothetical protein